MCGRYYIDDETARAIEKLVEQIDEKLKKEKLGCDIHPTDMAPVLCKERVGIKQDWLRWGVPGIHGKGVIFNARSETVLEKRMFSEGIRTNRIIVPCTWFYEWNRSKEKNTFLMQDKSVLFMAGFCCQFEAEPRFVILTTGANESMIQTHDRMPLLLEEGQIKSWIFDDGMTEDILHQRPVLLERRAGYEQQRLVFISY